MITTSRRNMKRKINSCYTYYENDLCSICSGKILDGVWKRSSSICEICIKKEEIIATLVKNSNGYYLDPITSKPISTCVCGKILYAMSSCYLLKMMGKEHGPIRNGYKKMKNLKKKLCI